MLQRLGFSLTTVIALNTLAQITNVIAMGLWGPYADRFGTKVILSAAASLYLLVILGWVFTTQPERYLLTVPLVIILQLFAGVAAAGVNLTVGTIGLKLSPQGESTSYLAVASLATNLGMGLGPLVGGLFADFFSVRTLRVNFDWISPDQSLSFLAVDLTGLDFLFGIAFFVGLITLNTLTTIREEGEVEQGVMMKELLAPSRAMTQALGSIPGVHLLVGYPYSYLRRVPGLEVALGVTGYQLASAIRSAVTAINAGQVTTGRIARRVSSSVAEAIGQADTLRESGLEVARQATRGAVNSVSETPHSIGQLSRGAVLGTLDALARTDADLGETVWGATYGTVQGASEAGADLGEAAVEAVAGAREAVRDLDLSDVEASRQATGGAMQAAADIGPEAVAQVTEALAQERLLPEPPDRPETGEQLAPGEYSETGGSTDTGAGGETA